MTNQSLNRLYYLNALFELYLGGFPVEKLSRTASEMSVLFLFMGNNNDRVLLDIELPDEYLCYLDSLKINYLKSLHAELKQTPGRFSYIKEDNSAKLIGDKKRSSSPLVGVPWGWEAHSLRHLVEAGAACDLPDLAIVRNVNSRQFHNIISENVGIGIPGTVYCGSCNSLMDCLKSNDNYPLVIKPSFGGSGFGFRIISSKDDAMLISKNIELLMEHGGVTVEPWYTRIDDFSSSVTISKDGTFSPIRHQRSFSSKYGTFQGIYMAASDPVIAKYMEIQERAVMCTAEELFRNGYFGPAGFDSFSYVDNFGEGKIAPVIEINARHSMSDVAHAIKNRFSPDKFCFFRMISKRRCNLPDTYNKLNIIIKGDLFNPDTQEGVILLTPLRLKKGKEFLQPLKSAFFLSAKSERELFEMDGRLIMALSLDLEW